MLTRHLLHAPDFEAVDDAPADRVQQMLRAIVGIQIPITRQAVAA